MEIDNKAILKRMITLCWVCLGICVAIKLFGGNYFEIVVTNQRFITICEYIDTHPVVLKLVQFVVYFTTTWLYFNSLLPTTRIELYTIFLALFLLKHIDMTTGVIVETLSMIIIPILYKVSIKDSIIHYVIIFGFQAVSMLLRNINTTYLPTYSLVGLIMSIDYYIMLTLNFLYRRKEQ